MSHLDPDTLTLLALGEESQGAGGHLASCGTCTADLASLRRTVTAGRAITEADRVSAPPPHLWDRIAAELSLTPAPPQAPTPGTNGHTPAAPPGAAEHATAPDEPTTEAPPTAPVEGEEPTGPTAPAPADAEEPAAPTAVSVSTAAGTQDEEPTSAAASTERDAPPAETQDVEPASAVGGPTMQGGVELGRLVEVGEGGAPGPAGTGPRDGRPPGPRSRARASKRRRASLVSGALVGLLALAAVLTFVLTSARPTVVAEAELAPLEGSSLEGSAQLVERDGALELRVDLDATTDDDRYYELWLLDTSGDRLVSLGPVAGDGVHPLPAGLTVADYPVVDVSSERFDGDPSHSGDSLSRGTLPV